MGGSRNSEKGTGVQPLQIAKYSYSFKILIQFVLKKVIAIHERGEYSVPLHTLDPPLLIKKAYIFLHTFHFIQESVPLGSITIFRIKGKKMIELKKCFQNTEFTLLSLFFKNYTQKHVFTRFLFINNA